LDSLIERRYSSPEVSVEQFELETWLTEEDWMMLPVGTYVEAEIYGRRAAKAGVGQGLALTQAFSFEAVRGLLHLSSGVPVSEQVSVYVAFEASDLYHGDSNCPRLGAHAAFGIGRCLSDDAHASALNPCPECAAGISEELRLHHGVIASGERRRRGRPRLVPISPAMSGDEEASEGGVPYGAPQDEGDIRFSNHSAADWGTASYGQNPAEYLAEFTDDDNDWRGGGSRLLD
jgi:hypothetical protein